MNDKIFFCFCCDESCNKYWKMNGMCSVCVRFFRGKILNKISFASIYEQKSNLGIVPPRRGSDSVACRRALAKALKVASIM